MVRCFNYQQASDYLYNLDTLKTKILSEKNENTHSLISKHLLFHQFGSYKFALY